MEAEVQGRGATAQVGVTSKNEVHLRLACAGDGLSIWLRPEQARQLAKDLAHAAGAAEDNEKSLIGPILERLRGMELTEAQAERLRVDIAARVRR